MIRLFLARHGNTFSSGETPYQIGSKTDLALSPSGRTQAEALGRHFKELGLEPSAIFSGSLKRQVQTAELIAEEVGFKKELRRAEGLNEIDFGVWEKKPLEEIQAGWPQQHADWSEQAKWGEGIFGGEESQTLGSIKSWLSALEKEFSDGETVLAVSSGGLIRYFYSLVPAQWRKLRDGRAMGAIKVRTGHYSELELGCGGVRVVSWGRGA